MFGSSSRHQEPRQSYHLTRLLENWHKYHPRCLRMKSTLSRPINNRCAGDRKVHQSETTNPRPPTPPPPSQTTASIAKIRISPFQRRGGTRAGNPLCRGYCSPHYTAIPASSITSKNPSPVYPRGSGGMGAKVEVMA